MQLLPTLSREKGRWAAAYTLISSLLLLTISTHTYAQVLPRPGIDDPRLQTVVWSGTQPIALIAYPTGTLSVIFHPGERLVEAEVSDRSAFSLAIPEGADSVLVRPMREDAVAILRVRSDRRSYTFDLSTGTGLMAAYVVRFVDAQPPFTVTNAARQAAITSPNPAEMGAIVGLYRVRGADALAPARMGDDGLRTYIDWPPEAALPAVFGLGPTGGEEVVDGHMRDGLFTIDRVYSELVFRIDDQRAVLRRRTVEPH